MHTNNRLQKQKESIRLALNEKKKKTSKYMHKSNLYGSEIEIRRQRSTNTRVSSIDLN